MPTRPSLSSDALIRVLNDRFDDQQQAMRDMFEQFNALNQERYKNLSERLSKQDQEIESKHLQNTSKSQDIELRLAKVETSLLEARTIWRFLLFLCASLATGIGWLVGLLDPIVRAIKTVKAGI